mmetsp:Transcript_147091/g.472465  ORF Transcript_147091/g.472465 Transcript_147091/m.472465 type:complete len:104 (-) Transcript_147091:83-394(-)
MSLTRCLVVALVALLAVAADASSLKHKGKGPDTATAMAGLEGEACGEDEYKRYKTVVCSIESACKCAGTVCELEWCSKYVHEWKKEFGACLLKGCGEEQPAEQ